MAVAQQPQEQAARIEPGRAVEGMVHREGKEWYQLSFPASGTATVEVTGFPTDCAFQIGSRGFQTSDSAPVDWTDGQPGKPVKHIFQVQAGKPGTVWVELRSRVAGASNANWVGVICSKDGPCYTTPPRGKAAGPAPDTFDGRPVRGPITFRLTASLEGTATGIKPGLPPGPGAGQGTGPGADRETISVPPPATTPTQPFRDDLIGFGFDYPAGWTAVGIERGTYRVTGPEGSAEAEAVVTIKIVAKKNPKDSTLKQLLKIHEELTSATGAIATKLGPTKAVGGNAVFAIHACLAAGASGKKTPFDHVQVVMEHGKNFYLVSFAAPHDLFVKQIPLFKQILTTWRY